MILSHFNDISRKLMPHNGRMLRHIIMNTFVILSENGTFVSGHTDTVRHHLNQYLIIRNLRQLKLLHPQILCSMQSHAFCFHDKTPFSIITVFLVFWQQQILYFQK